MDYTNELVLLLVNTLLSDLKSDNFITVCTALVVTTKLIGPDLINAVYPVVVEKLSHSKESVRKKAIMVLHHFHRLDPNHTGPLAGKQTYHVGIAGPATQCSSLLCLGQLYDAAWNVTVHLVRQFFATCCFVGQQSRCQSSQPEHYVTWTGCGCSMVSLGGCALDACDAARTSS